MKRAAALLCALLLLAGCGGTAATAAEPAADTIFAMDTVMTLTVYGDAALLTEAETLIRGLEDRLSVTDPDSEIAAVNRDGGGQVSEGTAALLERALALCAETDGALDISIYPVLHAWGFTTAGGDYAVPDPETLAALLARVDYNRVNLDRGAGSVSIGPEMEIDLGSVAKGWAGDRVLELFRSAGVKNALLDLGGNVQALGSKPDGSPWRVGIRDPDGDGMVGVVRIADRAVITSGGYERFFEQDGVVYWHILDPETGYPARSGLKSVTIVGPEGVRCDGLSTALFVMGAERAAEFWRERADFDFILVHEDGAVTITEGLEDSFALSDAYRGAALTVLRK